MATTDVTPKVLELRFQIAARARGVASEIEARLPAWRAARSPAAFRAMELEVAAVARDFANEVVEHILLDIVADPEFVVPARRAARAGLCKLRNGSGRKVTVTLLGVRKVNGQTGLSSTARLLHRHPM